MKINQLQIEIDGIDKEILRDLMEVICRDNEHLMQLLNKKIQPIDGVSRTETFISLEQQIERQIQL